MELEQRVTSIHSLSLCLFGVFFFFLRSAGQRRPTHSTPQCCSQDGESAKGRGFWVGAEQKIKRRMIDIIHRVSAGLKALASQVSPLKKILSNRLSNGSEKGGGCFLQALTMRSRQGRGNAENRRAPPRLTLKSLRASVCSASEGSVVRGECSPSLQKLKASLLHKADSGKRTTHTRTHT